MLVNIDGQGNDRDQKGEQWHKDKRLQEAILAGALGEIAEHGRHAQFEHNPQNPDSEDQAEEIKDGARFVERLGFRELVRRQAVFRDFELLPLLMRLEWRGRWRW